ncbi:MAG: hypothetical protein EXR76_17180 [Myxococcales bacterium]|nr:hypothetical protein [Myxococcales bacterium]
MTNDEINLALRKLVPEFQDREGLWSLQHGETPITVMTDREVDRLRVIAPVPGVDLTDATFLYRLLRANFETALDARYCIFRGTLYAAFMHPMSTLTEPVFIEGLEQVVTLVSTTGDSFRSTGLRFSGGEGH